MARASPGEREHAVAGRGGVLPGGGDAAQLDLDPAHGARLAPEGAGDLLLGRLVVRARLLRELADAVQRLLDAARGALPLGPQLLEARLGDALPLALERRDLATPAGEAWTRCSRLRR